MIPMTVRKSKSARRAPAAAARKAEAEPSRDLLADGLLGIETIAHQRRFVTLPEALALLAQDEVTSFTALQAHQHHGWHAFLVQLAALALHRSGRDSPRLKAGAWREILESLTEHREAWFLVVPHLKRPAFMQPPVPEGTLDDFNDPQACSDEIDVLVTSKNHDVKAAKVVAPRPEHWVYALVTLQTMEGFSGRDNYGIARMNSGTGSRSIIGLSSSASLGKRFLRDVSVLLEARDGIAAERGYASSGGIPLLWCEPWDGEKSLGLKRLDPLFIEVCRRVRLVGEGGAILLRRKTTKCQRILAGELKGNTGDPWMPVNHKEAKAFTATEAGFSYRVLQRLLSSEEFALAPAMRPRHGEKDVLLLATVLARGNGKTGGFHHRALPVPGQVTGLLRRAGDHTQLGRIAAERVELVSIVQNRVLRPALKVLLQGGPEKLKQDDDRPDAWVHAHDAMVDGVFFERLWADLERDPRRLRSRLGEARARTRPRPAGFGVRRGPHPVRAQIPRHRRRRPRVWRGRPEPRSRCLPRRTGVRTCSMKPPPSRPRRSERWFIALQRPSHGRSLRGIWQRCAG
ncbi:MAG: type I-E CRISPR-associated protein Cse1/CasA [Anaeromyxobacter sp.]